MRKQSKSPFLVVEEFISPLTCEEIVDTITFGYPETDVNGRVLPTVLRSLRVENKLSDPLGDLLPLMEPYYGVEVEGVLPLEIEWYPQGCATTRQRCENSTYAGGKWTRSNNRDFVGVLFLSDYQAKAPFDPDFEVRGGKLQFPNHGFGFNPKRGMLVIFPGSSNFLNSTAAIEVGDLTQIRIPFTTVAPYVYDMKNFPGNYEVWFG